MANNKKARRLSRRASFPNGLEVKLGHGPSQVGMVMMMMPGDECHCHKESVYQSRLRSAFRFSRFFVFSYFPGSFGNTSFWFPPV
jgi:hypothetical protein